MKKIITGTLLFSISTFAFAHGPAGCGVGNKVFENPSSWIEHVLAVSTNFSASNTVSMTSNLLDCDVDGPLKLARIFIEENMDQLAADTAMGQGETLAALAEVIGVEAQDSAAFNQTMQANFDAMFSTEATSNDAYEAMKAAMAQDVNLKKYLG